MRIIDLFKMNQNIMAVQSTLMPNQKPKKKTLNVKFQQSPTISQFLLTFEQMQLNLMKPINENLYEFDDYLEQLQPVINRTLDRQNTILEKRFFLNLIYMSSALDRANNNLFKYRESLQNLKDSIDKSESIKNTLTDVENFRGYSQLLKSDLDSLDNQIGEQQQEGRNLNAIIKAKHSKLKKKNVENLILLREINRFRNLLKRSVSSKPNETLMDHLQDQSIAQNGLSGQIERVANENKVLRHLINQKTNNYFQKITLFEECLDCIRKQLEKSQKVANTKNGLQGSLLFEIKRAQLFLTEQDISTSQRKAKSANQVRDLRVVVHDTLKNMLEGKEGKRVKYLKDFNIQWETYRQFQPIQLLGVMSLKPKVFEDLTGILQYKARKIKQANSNI